MQEALPLYVDGADLIDPGAHGRITVHTGETPGATRTYTTEQATILDALDDDDPTPPVDPELADVTCPACLSDVWNKHRGTCIPQGTPDLPECTATTVDRDRYEWECTRNVHPPATRHAAHGAPGGTVIHTWTDQ